MRVLNGEMRAIWDDLRFSARTLNRNRGTSAVAICVLAIAIGANAALFTVMNAVLLRPREIYRYLQSGGLRLVGRDYIVFFPRWLRWFRPLEPFLRWCPLGAQYVVVGEKFA